MFNIFIKIEFQEFYKFWIEGIKVHFVNKRHHLGWVSLVAFLQYREVSLGCQKLSGYFCLKGEHVRG